MKLKTLAAATVIAFSSHSASAALTELVEVKGSSFEKLLGSISLASFSDVAGGLDYVLTMSIWNKDYALPAVTFTGLYLGTYAATIGTGNTFTFSDVAAGNYDLKATGSVAGGGTNYIQAQYNVTPVPEPESYAMLLAGLGVMGAIARRRNKAGSAA